MALIEWQDSYAIGIASVDHEHQELIAMINALHDHLGSAGSAEDISRFLGEIDSMIAAHFALEEKAMRDLGYDGYPAHKADHERLLEEIREIADAFEAGAYADLDGTLAENLRSWFAVHFREQDAPLHQFLERQGA